MKKQFTMLSLLVIVAANVISCKKDTTSLKARMMGKWIVNKIEVSGDPDLEANGSFTYKPTDYIDFKADNDDQVELSLDQQRTIGTYVTTGSDFSMTFPEGNLFCTVKTISGSQFQFTAKLDKTNITRVYYLNR